MQIRPCEPLAQGECGPAILGRDTDPGSVDTAIDAHDQEATPWRCAR